MSRTMLGVEWRDRVLAMIEVERRGDRVEVLRSLAHTCSPDEVLDASRISALLDAAGFRSDTARLVVSGRSTSLKPLRLPAVDRGMLLPLLNEHGDSYFLVPQGPRCYGAFGNDVASGTEFRWAAAAPADELEALIRGFETAGVHVDWVTSAVSVYPHAARFLGRNDQVSAVLRSTREGAEWVTYDNGHLADVRWPAADGEALRVAAPNGAAPAAGVLVLADPEAAPGAEVPAAPGLDRSGTFAGALGAALAPAKPADCPDLMPLSVQERRGSRRRRLTRALGAGVAALVLLLGWQVAAERERAARQLEQALGAAESEAEPVLQRRSDLAVLSRRLSAFGRLSRPSGYLPSLDALSEALPDDAWLVSFVSATPDEAVLTGFAGSAAGVLASLSEALEPEEIAFAQPIRKVAIAGEELESFTMQVRLRAGNGGKGEQ